MNYAWRTLAAFFPALLLLSLCACGGSPWRFDPGLPDRPAGLVATAGNGQVSLSWSAANNAAGYNIYYSTSPGVTAGNGTKIPNIAGSSTTVSGLTNDILYYFVISSVNSSGESSLSDQVSSIPSVPGPFLQSDLQGTWRFNALVSGVGARWMRGTVAIDASGKVSVTSFLDSSGNTAEPATLFTTMTILPDGSVFQDGAAADFHAVLSADLNNDLLVGTASAGGGSPMMVILQKSVPGITFSAADIKGTGKLVAGPLSLVYHQLSSGALSQWEYASCQVGQDQEVTYLSLDNPSAARLPGGGGKVVSLSITAGGIVSETPVAGVLPQPAALITQGVMSADKMTIVGTATDINGAFILRVVQLVHPPSILLTSSSYAQADLAGSYGINGLTAGVSPLWNYGSLSVASSGAAAYNGYRDASGSATLPGPFTLAMDAQGALSDPADPSYSGQFSYLNDMVVATKTDALGVDSLSIALKR